MIRDALQQIVASAVASLVDSGQLPEAVRSVRIEITDTKQPEHGDYACNFALTASKAAGMNPRPVGEMLRNGITALRHNGATDSLSTTPQHRNAETPIHSIEIAGPGFLNFRLNPAWVASFVPQVLEVGSDFGRTPQSAIPNPQSINVEFVSVNPNGPITIGSGRGAAYGSTLCNVLEAAGTRVHREYYINDGVNSEQMRLFAESVRANILQAIGIPFPVPEKGYRGDYVTVASEDCWVRMLRMADDVSSQPDYLYWFDLKPVSGPTLSETLQFATLRKLADFLINGKLDLSALDQPSSSIFERARLEVHKHLLNMGVTSTLDEVLDRTTFVLLDSGWLQVLSQDLMVVRQRKSLCDFGVTFDIWFSEQSLHDSGEVSKEIDKMVASGVADDEEVRTVLKLARGGVIEDVEKQDQTGKVEEDDDLGTEEQGSGGAEEGLDQSSNPALQHSSNSKTLWLRSAKFGDDMDRVLKRRDGRLTYIASDVAYHKDKLTDASGTRGTGPVDKMITILGPDHHGYIGRLQAVVAAMLMAEGMVGDRIEGLKEERIEEEPPAQSSDPRSSILSEVEAKLYSSPEERDTCQAALREARQKLEVQIYQLVRFMKDGKPAPMRKRDGNIYALIDLMREIGENVKPNGTEEEKLEVGKDVARFFYLMRSHDTTFDFDLDLAQKQSDENPVFYVQYAHARICSVIERARIEGLKDQRTGNEPDAQSSHPQSFNPSVLTHDRELALIRKICDLPFEVQRCAEDYGVHRLTTYAIELARTYHHFYDACRVIQPDQPELSQARLALCEATKTALKATLDLLGISAPVRM